MDNLGTDSLGRMDAVPGAGKVRPVGPAADVAERGSGQPIPGLSAFDRLSLRAGPQVVEAYAKFTVHSDSGVVSIKIIDARTDRVIREIPPDEVVRIAEQLQAYLEARRQRK